MGVRMIKPLEKIKPSLYHIERGVRIDGPNPLMSGNCSHLRGDCTDIRGNCTGLRGYCSGLRGNCAGLKGDCSGLRGDGTGLKGDCTYIWGDLSRIPMRERDEKPNLYDWIKND